MAREVVVVKERPVARVRAKPYIILSNVVVSAALTLIGLLGMILTDRVAGVIFEWSTLIGILGLVSFWLVPLEILVIKPSQRQVS